MLSSSTLGVDVSGRAVVGVVSAVAVLLCGCVPLSGPTVSPSPSPTFWCTPLPTPGVSPGPPAQCSEDAFKRGQERAALESEAVAVYGKYFAEFTRLRAAGGATEVTEALAATTDGSFQKTSMATLEDQKGKGRVVKGEAPTTKVGVNREESLGDALVTLTACEDNSRSALYESDGQKVGDGLKSVYVLFLHQSGGQLKIFANIKRDLPCPLG